MKLAKYSKIALILAFILFAYCVVAGILRACDIYFFIGKLGTPEIFLVSGCVIVYLILSAIIVTAFKNAETSKRKWIVVIVAGIVSVIVCGICFFVLVFSSWGNYYRFTSDDGKHKIITDDRAWLLAGWGNVYEQTSFCTMKKVGEFATDDGYRLFSFDFSDYYFVWKEATFELHSDAIIYPENGILVMEYVK